MKITNIQTKRLTLPDDNVDRSGRGPGWAETAEVANPMSRYPHVASQRTFVAFYAICNCLLSFGKWSHQGFLYTAKIILRFR